MRELARYFLADEAKTHEDVAEAHDLRTLGIPRARADVYRRLVRLASPRVISNAFPVARAIYGPRLDAEVMARRSWPPAGRPPRTIAKSRATWCAGPCRPSTRTPSCCTTSGWSWWPARATRPTWTPGTPEPRPGASVDAAWPVDLNPTLQLAVYTRPVHLISADVPSPEPFATPSAYAVWRRPRSDVVVFHRLGLVLARALELAQAAPQPVEAPRRAVAAEAGLDAAVIAPVLPPWCESSRVGRARGGERLAQNEVLSRERR
jgi:hypothetical protein